MTLTLQNAAPALLPWAKGEILRRRAGPRRPSPTAVDPTGAARAPAIDIPEAFEPLLQETYVQMTYPDPELDEASLGHMLTDRVLDALAWLFPILRSQAASSLVSVTKVEVDGFTDPEEGYEEVVVTQWVELGPEQALDYWDQLGARIEEWSDFLPAQLARIVSDRIAVRIWWETP